MRYLVVLLLVCFGSCLNESKKSITAQQIVDKAIEVSGGKLHNTHTVSFDFRGKTYEANVINGKKILKRISRTDSLKITDVLTNNDFQRFVNDSLVTLPDSMANRYANSVNSVHYFARLPQGLNDRAVNKELLGEAVIKNKKYYKVKVTFDQEGGGDDFEDTYLYWFDKETFKPDYLAYEFHVNGGGIRFREAYNERYVNGIRFVDYNNYKPKEKAIDFFAIDSLFGAGNLELLSKIELKNVHVEKNP
ncbi:MAG: deoxyribose-phosphate aldolase [Muricauda sp.]|nr:DUF6503 family protein [Allomuricauda sp.]MBC29304.1 deoxyribose-phosphate aldolase [Allomuricauda sp.]